MSKETLVEQILVYTGDSPYIKILREQLIRGEELNATQQLLAKSFITSHAIEQSDKSLIPKPFLKDFKIDWNRYDQRMPFDFQKEGINWLLNKKRSILADEMGLGKSIQSIIAALEGNFKKILIICPNTLKYNWESEVSFYNPNVTIIDKKWESDKFVVINYDKLVKYWKEIQKAKFELIIADEAHYLSNMKSKRSKHFAKIANKCANLWLLTGTPIANRPINFYNLLKLCKHDLGKRKDEFVPKFCGGILGPFGWQLDGASNLKELHYKTQDIILRRTKDEVLDLPPKTRQPIILELKNKKAYNDAIKDYYAEDLEVIEFLRYKVSGKLDITEAENYLVELAILRQFTALEKVRDGSTPELIDNILDQGGKVVVYTNYRAVIDKLVEIYGDQITYIDGRVSPEERQKRVQAFQNDPKIKIIVNNYKAASTGLTLTAASTMIMNDLDWTPANVGQAEDRCHRIGTKYAVTILYPQYKGTIEDMMFAMYIEKFKNIALAIDGIDSTPFDMKTLYSLLKATKN